MSKVTAEVTEVSTEVTGATMMCGMAMVEAHDGMYDWPVGSVFDRSTQMVCVVVSLSKCGWGVDWGGEHVRGCGWPRGARQHLICRRSYLRHSFA